MGGRGTGGGREKGWKWEFKAKMGGCGTEMQNATRSHLVCIRIPKVQEHEMIFDLHQRLLSNLTNKNSNRSEKQAYFG